MESWSQGWFFIDTHYCISGEIGFVERIEDLIRRNCIAKVNFIFQETAISYKKGTSS